MIPAILNEAVASLCPAARWIFSRPSLAFVCPFAKIKPRVARREESKEKKKIKCGCWRRTKDALYPLSSLQINVRLSPSVTHNWTCSLSPYLFHISTCSLRPALCFCPLRQASGLPSTSHFFLHFFFGLAFHCRTCERCVCLCGRQGAAEKRVFGRNQRCLLKETRLCLTLPKKKKKKRCWSCCCIYSAYLARTGERVFILSLYAKCALLANSMKSTINWTVSSV